MRGGSRRQSESGKTGHSEVSQGAGATAQTLSDATFAIATQAIAVPANAPDDPGFKHQQYLFSGDASDTSVGIDINSLPAWALGNSGKGVSIGVYDTAMDTRHADLRQNVDMSKAIKGADATKISAYGDEHATAVAGIIAGARNGTGIVGVAYDAKITPVNIFDTDSNPNYIWDAIDQQGRFDVTNHSWAFTTAFDSSSLGVAGLRKIDGFADAADHGRGGLGTIANVAAGNYREYGFGTELNVLTIDRHVVVVGATDLRGEITSYSNPGASLLVVAPSSDDQGGITTTDVRGRLGYSPGNYTDGFGGTSAATPQVSGIEALMLEANPWLGWRDVQTILAITARHTGSAIGDGPRGHESAAWLVNHAAAWNGGGYHFSNDYGFGLVDARAAVALAETWSEIFGAHTSRNERMVSGGVKGAWNLGGGHTTEFSIGVGKHVAIEALILKLPDLSFNAASHLLITITSPTGTVSNLLDHVGGAGASIHGGWELMSRAFLGEDAHGVWTVTITSSDPGDIGHLSKATLKAYGSPVTSGVFFYTDEFATAWSDTRGLLSSPGTPATINAAAVSDGISLDLSAALGSVAGKQLMIAEGTVVGAVVGGVGDDVIVGDWHGLKVVAGRGDDSVVGSIGADRISGGTGNDALDGAAGNDAVMGGAGSDRLAGGWGNDTIHGDRGSDVIEGDLGRDILDGGAGWDRVSYEHASAAVRIDLAAIGWQVTGGAGVDKLTGFQLATGSAYDDWLAGDRGRNVLQGSEGNDTLYGRGGADRLDGGAGVDKAHYADARSSVTVNLARGLAWGGAGRDTLVDIENVGGSRHDDLIVGDALDNRLIGDRGNDRLEGRGGADVLIGSAGVDTAVYSGSPEGVTVDLADGSGHGGDAEGDVLGGIENIVGSSFADRLSGTSNDNKIVGAAGDDTIEGRGGNDVLDGGSGRDTVSYEHAHSGVAVDLATSHAQRTWGAGTDILRRFENVTGSDHADHLSGNAGNNVITGGIGRDEMTGRLGADSFHFRSEADGGDIIRDFRSGEGDRILIDRAGFGIGDDVALGLGDSRNFTNYWVSGPGAVADSADHGQFVFNTTSHVLYWDADGAGVLAPVAIAFFANGAGLRASDFDLL